MLLDSASSQWPLFEHWPDLGLLGWMPALSRKWSDKQLQYGPLSLSSCLPRIVGEFNGQPAEAIFL